MPRTAILFPGQGSLTPDSADHARAVCPDLVERAAAVVGADPFARAAESTRYAQPAIFVASMAGWYERRGGRAGVIAMAGHSLGELSALAAAGALDVHDALRLVTLRGELMADAAENTPGGGMIALLGVDRDDATELGGRHGLRLANDNAPGQLVLSGRGTAVAGFAEAARAAGMRALELDVTGAFHSPDMQPAQLPFQLALEEVEFRQPTVPVISGLTARPFRNPPVELSLAVQASVRWREVMAVLRSIGAEEFVDVGPGSVLARLVKRNPATHREQSHALAG